MSSSAYLKHYVKIHSPCLLCLFDNTLCNMNFAFYPCITMFTSLDLVQGGKHKAVK